MSLAPIYSFCSLPLDFLTARRKLIIENNYLLYITTSYEDILASSVQKSNYFLPRLHKTTKSSKKSLYCSSL